MRSFWAGVATTIVVGAFAFFVLWFAVSATVGTPGSLSASKTAAPRLLWTSSLVACTVTSARSMLETVRCISTLRIKIITSDKKGCSRKFAVASNPSGAAPNTRQCHGGAP
jgi:hypothetical protein